MSVAEFLGLLDRVKRNGSGWIARCPAHEDRNPSLAISEGEDGRVLLHCHAGCTTEQIVTAVGRTLADLFPEGGGRGYIPPVSRQVRQVRQVAAQPASEDGDRPEGLTVEALAEAKRLPVALLMELGCETVPYHGPPSVMVPYSDEAGEIVGVRYRLALSGDTKWKWRKGTKASRLLYGASRLHEARDAGYVVLVEGESDAWTLIHHGFPVIALPGAGMWTDEHHAERLDGIETVYVIAEPDKGGKQLLDDLSTSAIRPRVRVVTLSTKDASELHLLDEATFAERLREAMEAATTLPDIEQERRREQAADEWESCRELAAEPSILDCFATELRARGFVGSLDTPVLVYLVLVSRLLRRPVSLVLRGLSSAGKSYTVESVLPFFPPSAYFDRSGMSERALIYSEESFEHRILYVAEADAIAGEHASYYLRTLLSENRLIYETVEKVRDRLVTRLIVKPGPTGTIITTTRLRLHPENETRMLALTVPDDPALTRQIMRAIARRDEDALDAEPPESWPALQRWLELGGEHRVIDEHGFLLAVADLVPVVAVRLRRDFALVRSLVFAHALLHQASRPYDERGRVLATLDDYDAVRHLIAEIVAEGIGATVSDDVRETVAAVQAALDAEAPAATVKRAEVQAKLGLDERATNRRLWQACEAGFVENMNPGRGKVGLYKIGNPIPDDIDVLPSAAEVRRHLGNLDTLATDPRDRPPPPPPPLRGEEWLARDGLWRSVEQEPPAFPAEVVETRGGTP